MIKYTWNSECLDNASPIASAACTPNVFPSIWRDFISSHLSIASTISLAKIIIKYNEFSPTKIIFYITHYKMHKYVCVVCACAMFSLGHTGTSLSLSLSLFLSIYISLYIYISLSLSLSLIYLSIPETID